MRAVFIYALKDPVTGLIRYIGKSTNPARRLWAHFKDAKTKTHRCSNWIRSLLKRGYKPELEFLAQVPEATWPQDEIDYIAAFRSLGYDLVNLTSGGEGVGSDEKNHRFGKAPWNKGRCGQIPWNKGKICPTIRAAQKNNPKSPCFKPGYLPWNKGKSCPEISARLLGEKNPAFGKPPWNKGMKNGKRE